MDSHLSAGKTKPTHLEARQGLEKASRSVQGLWRPRWAWTQHLRRCTQWSQQVAVQIRGVGNRLRLLTAASRG